MIGDLPAMDARVEEISEDYASVGLFKEPEPPLKDIGPIQGIIEAAGPRGLTRLVGTLEQKGSEVDVVTLEFDQGPEVIQRRQFVRIETSTSVVITRADGSTLTAQTLNLSGAGLLLGGVTLDMDEVIKLDVDVGEEEPDVHVRGRVVRSPDEGQQGIRFEVIEEGDRERLIHFVFERQRTQAHVRTR
jgi:hypothetical protein